MVEAVISIEAAPLERSRIRLKSPMGLTPHSDRTGSGVYWQVMENKPSRTRLPPPATESDDTRIDIDRLETEAQTHDCRRDDSEKERPVVPSGSAAREGTAVFQSLLPGGRQGGFPCLMLGQRL